MNEELPLENLAKRLAILKTIQTDDNFYDLRDPSLSPILISHLDEAIEAVLMVEKAFELLADESVRKHRESGSKKVPQQVTNDLMKYGLSNRDAGLYAINACKNMPEE